MMEDISFGKWLRQRRRTMDLSQRALADQATCARITLSRIEADTLKPSKELALILLEKVGIAEGERPQWVAFARGLSGFPMKPTTSSLSTQLSNLPAPITTFVGREREQIEIIGLIRKHRLVTLTGSGGVGKTRLSLKIGKQVLEDYVNGVWLVELASLNDPALLPQTVAKVFGLVTQSEISILEILLNFLRAKTTLLILDNCEHLLDACAQLTNTLLTHCSNLKILATSREPMNITGEAIYRVPSLALPDVHQLLDQFKDYESVQLFVERAQLAQTDFSLTMDDASFVAQICSRLDGIPLALELTAAKVGSLSVGEIAEQLEMSFSMLTGGSRTALPRQQTIRASIEWSWTLLSAEECILMQQLSVFAGGWTLESAEAVCDGDVLGLMDSLVKKSLIALNQQSGSQRRYRFHQMIRQYAREKLVEAGEEENIRTRHLAYFVQLAEQAEPELYRSNQLRWLNRLDDEIDNLRMALEWALATNIEAGLRIAATPWRFWQRGYLRELGESLAQFLDRHNTVDSLHVQALLVYSYCNFYQGNFSETLKIAGQALQMARTLSDKQMEAFSLSVLGLFTLVIESAAGVPLLEQGLGIYRTLGNKIGQADALYWLSINNKDMESTIDLSRESLSLYRELGNLSGIAASLTVLARLTIWMGRDFSSPGPWLEEALSISRQLGEQAREAEILVAFGHLSLWQGDYRRAIAHFAEAILLSEKIGEHYQNLWGHVHRAHAVLRQGDIHQARGLFKDNIRITQKAGSMLAIVNTVEGVASLNANQNQSERAARLFAWTDATRERIGIHRHPVELDWIERDLAVIHSKIDDTEFARLSAEGCSMTSEQAIALALQE